MTNDIEDCFDKAMINIYLRARDEAKYTATRFLQMLHKHRGLGTARILLHSATVSEDFTALFERDHLDLTVEALILEPEWYELFSTEERDIARKRLQGYGYDQ